MGVSRSAKSQLKASGDAPIFACRAWVNFNGTGTVAIRASGNVSSITDNGVGDYTVNFTTAMQDSNHATVVSAGANLTTGKSTLLAGSARVLVINTASAMSDASDINVSVFR